MCGVMICQGMWPENEAPTVLCNKKIEWCIKIIFPVPLSSKFVPPLFTHTYLPWIIYTCVLSMVLTYVFILLTMRDYNQNNFMMHFEQIFYFANIFKF